MNNKISAVKASHGNACRADAIGCAVENIRDAAREEYSAEWARTADAVVVGDGYLESGMVDCICAKIDVASWSKWIELGMPYVAADQLVSTRKVNANELIEGDIVVVGGQAYDVTRASHAMIMSRVTMVPRGTNRPPVVAQYRFSDRVIMGELAKAVESKGELVQDVPKVDTGVVVFHDEAGAASAVWTPVAKGAGVGKLVIIGAALFDDIPLADARDELVSFGFTLATPRDRDNDVDRNHDDIIATAEADLIFAICAAHGWRYIYNGDKYRYEVVNATTEAMVRSSVSDGELTHWILSSHLQGLLPY